MPRRRQRRHGYGRRRADIWGAIGKLAGVVASASAAVLGQAELIGEPTRHYVTVVSIAALGVFAFLSGPQQVRMLLDSIKRR
jgi:hypothetical protein